MKRREFIKGFLAAGLMIPALKAYALFPDTNEKPNANALEGGAEPDIADDMDYLPRDAVIKVIGVGCCGANAVDYMIAQGVKGVEFIALGIKEDRAQISNMIINSHLVFIVAGMGEGNGSDVSLVVAEIARGLGILTVAVVTSPSAEKGEKLFKNQFGIAALAKQVDTLIVVPNDMQIEGDILLSASYCSDNVIREAVAAIAEMINVPGLIAVDFADVHSVISAKGMAMTGCASATGTNRASIAAERALASPLLAAMDMSSARGLLVNITSTNQLKLKELEAVMEWAEFAAAQASIVVGAVFDENMGDELRVTFVATGISQQV